MAEAAEKMIVARSLSLLTDAEYYKETREILHYESELINRRLTWLITSQAIVFAAITATAVITKDGRPKAFELMFMVGATMGFAISLGVLCGVGAAIAEAHEIYKEFEGEAAKRSQLQTTRLYLRRTRKATLFFGEFTALLLPCAFFAAWLFAVWHHARHFADPIQWEPRTFALLIVAPIAITSGLTLWLTRGLFAKPTPGSTKSPETTNSDTQGAS